ncbi:MAG: hypothetical protein RL238_1253 [Actinomycetota bacterium]|jgi:hypothetical protein
MEVTQWRPVEEPQSGLGRLGVAVTVVIAAITIPMLLFGLLVLDDKDATAPGTSAVPLPDGWQRRELLTDRCSATGGEFCTFAVLTPANGLTRSEAETDYRTFLADQGWSPSLRDGDKAFTTGRIGQEIILTVGSDGRDLYSTETYGDPPAPNDVVVEASYADLGRARQERLGRRFITAATAIIVAAALIVLAGVLVVERRRRRSHPEDVPR